MLSGPRVSWRCCSITAPCPGFLSGKPLEVLERVMSSWLAREPLLLLGLAAGTLACGPPAHQLQRKRRWLQDYKVRQRHIPFLPPQQQTLLCPGGSQAVLSRAAQQHSPDTLWITLWSRMSPCVQSRWSQTAGQVPRSVLSPSSPA